MIINNTGKMIGGEAVTFDYDKISFPPFVVIIAINDILNSVRFITVFPFKKLKMIYFINRFSYFGLSFQTFFPFLHMRGFRISPL
jgi:hypothetical protein